MKTATNTRRPRREKRLFDGYKQRAIVLGSPGTSSRSGGEEGQMTDKSAADMTDTTATNIVDNTAVHMADSMAANSAAVHVVADDVANMADNVVDAAAASTLQVPLSHPEVRYNN